MRTFASRKLLRTATGGCPVWPLFAVALALVVLPRAKGLLLSVIWATRGPGSERD